MNEKLKEYKQFKTLEPNKYFQLGNVTLKTIEHNSQKDGLFCEYCYMYENDIAKNISCDRLQELGILPYCSMEQRKDKRDIIFQEVKFNTSLLEVIDRNNECLVELYGEIIEEKEVNTGSGETVIGNQLWETWNEWFNVLFKTSEGKLIKLKHNVVTLKEIGEQIKDDYYLEE